MAILSGQASATFDMNNQSIDDAKTVQFNSETDNGSKTTDFSITWDNAQKQKVTLTVPVPLGIASELIIMLAV